ncbi:DUF1003 domain-containing protein [Tsuneonella mangrovi]|uniref:DUF1003 domain-containing protein n=1 Tax=Tsuneonella mangrovi TaxID=1982042 RepID=UPI000BA1E96B|nr:DUF1003 domain-containing protein [Tsuneonella mangrovi]
MTQRSIDPEKLAHELLGRVLEDLDAEEQRVIERVASGTFVGVDADEAAQLHASFGDRLADRVAAIGGSWGFIIAFGVVLLAWMLINSQVLGDLGIRPFDRYPYIFLNLILSMLAAIQAPVIMMSQNRQAAKDRVAAKHDYEVNLRTQLEILRLSRKIDRFARQVLDAEAARKVQQSSGEET